MASIVTCIIEVLSNTNSPDSKLTWMLKDSLGGNAKCTMIATVTQNEQALQETLSTLRFASRAKLITNKARVNQSLEATSVLALQQGSTIHTFIIEMLRLQSQLQQQPGKMTQH
jgi:hypothetical protein